MTSIYNNGILILIARLRLQVMNFWKKYCYICNIPSGLEKKHWCPLLSYRLSNHNLPIATGGWKMYYYKIEYVHYITIVISEMNFITFLPVRSLKMWGNDIYHLFVSPSLAHISFINYLTVKKLVFLKQLSIICSLIMNICKSSGWYSVLYPPSCYIV